jgi:hypothetical protein
MDEFGLNDMGALGAPNEVPVSPSLADLDGVTYGNPDADYGLDGSGDPLDQPVSFLDVDAAEEQARSLSSAPEPSTTTVEPSGASTTGADAFNWNSLGQALGSGVVAGSQQIKRQSSLLSKVSLKSHRASLKRKPVGTKGTIFGFPAPLVLGVGALAAFLLVRA